VGTRARGETFANAGDREAVASHCKRNAGYSEAERVKRTERGKHHPRRHPARSRHSQSEVSLWLVMNEFAQCMFKPKLSPCRDK
jgi:hypothetical protein